MSIEYIIIICLLIMVMVMVIVFVIKRQQWGVATEQRLVALEHELELEKKQALLLQRGTLYGKFFEKFGLHSNDSKLPYNPFDVYPLYNAPVDFIAFCGLEESNGLQCSSIDLLEFKSGTQKKLSPRQQAIKQCCVSHNIEFVKVSNKPDGTPYVVGTLCKKPDSKLDLFEPFDEIDDATKKMLGIEEYYVEDENEE